jgi:hypothetical protein
LTACRQRLSNTKLRYSDRAPISNPAHAGLGVPPAFSHGLAEWASPLRSGGFCKEPEHPRSLNRSSRLLHPWARRARGSRQLHRSQSPNAPPRRGSGRSGGPLAPEGHRPMSLTPSSGSRRAAASRASSSDQPAGRHAGTLPFLGTGCDEARYHRRAKTTGRHPGRQAPS